jgi:transposase
VAGIDDWVWKKGATYGTMILDLERRQIVDVLADRSADSTAEWLRIHPEVEIVSRDRAGLYADGARQGAPQARQIADRFRYSRTFGKPSSGSWVGWVHRSTEGRLRARTMASTQR